MYVLVVGRFFSCFLEGNPAASSILCARVFALVSPIGHVRLLPTCSTGDDRNVVNGAIWHSIRCCATASTASPSQGKPARTRYAKHLSN